MKGLISGICNRSDRENAIVSKCNKKRARTIGALNAGSTSFQVQVAVIADCITTNNPVGWQLNKNDKTATRAGWECILPGANLWLLPGYILSLTKSLVCKVKFCVCICTEILKKYLEMLVKLNVSNWYLKLIVWRVITIVCMFRIVKIGPLGGFHC